MSIDNSSSLTDPQFEALASIIYKDSGIVINDAKRGLLMARLNRRLRSLGMANYRDYCSFLDGPDGPLERKNIISSITTNVTSFFREKHHFEALSARILPGLIALARKGERVRIWSCACSSGEEPYSIAMTLLQLEPAIESMDILILGTDIDPIMVRRAEEGIFSQDAVQSLDLSRQQRFFLRRDNQFEISDDLRKITRFAELNLHDEWPFNGMFDIIFCRNVVIYFDQEGRQSLWCRLGRRLKTGGHLFIGHSERLDGPASRDFRVSGPTQYLKIGAIKD